jgi:hypothetical protein
VPYTKNRQWHGSDVGNTTAVWLGFHFGIGSRPRASDPGGVAPVMKVENVLSTQQE